MTICYLALGSNLSSPKRQLQTAIKSIRHIPNTCLKKVSPIYQSKPFGVSSLSQPNYSNAVVIIETKLPPGTLLHYCQLIEKKQKRVRLKYWGARTMDIDILLFGGKNIQTKDLTIPHPRMHERDFVLVPLLDIWPDATLPDGTCLTSCLRKLSVRCIRN